METQQPFAEWAIVELLGHRRLAGHLQEVQLAGAGFLRLDIPEADGDPARTQYIAPGSVYALHPVTEATARAAARQWRPEPVSRWELTALAGFPNPPFESAGAVACTEDDMSYRGDAWSGDEDDDPGGCAAEANQDSDGETTACPCDQFCPDGERCDGLTTQEAVAQLNAEQRADEADDLDQAGTKPAAEGQKPACSGNCDIDNDIQDPWCPVHGNKRITVPPATSRPGYGHTAA